MNEQLSDLRADAAAQAEAAAQAKVQENLEAAKEAIRFSWFGEFDPADEAAAWARLTAEIAVLGTDQKEKVYLSDAPNGKRKTYDEGRGFFYGASVAVRVIEEQEGWTKIEAYNDRDELEQGWVKSSRIRTVTPNQTYGIIVDKMTQRLYLYKEGRLLTTLLCSTGTTSGGNSAINETASGEFLLCSWTCGFWSGNLYCDQAIRFNGGDLMHMVPAIYSGGQDENGNPVEKEIENKIFPSYVLVKMKMSDATWHVVRNIRGVTGFVGPGSKPVPLSDEEVAAIGVDTGEIKLDYEVGDSVTVKSGPLKGYVGTVEEISEDRKKIKVLLSMFGRETPLELDSDSAEKLYK